MRVWIIAAIAVAVSPRTVLACTCDGTQSIGRALSRADAVVIGQVTGRTERSYLSGQISSSAALVGSRLQSH